VKMISLQQKGKVKYYSRRKRAFVVEKTNLGPQKEGNRISAPKGRVCQEMRVVSSGEERVRLASHPKGEELSSLQNRICLGGRKPRPGKKTPQGEKFRESSYREEKKKDSGVSGKITMDSRMRKKEVPM